jgi:hypothetical protein
MRRKAREQGLLPKAPGGVEGTRQEEPGGSDAPPGATQERRRNRRPREKTEARKAKEQQRFEEKQEWKRAAARAEAVHAAHVAALKATEAQHTEERAAAEAAPTPAEPAMTPAMVPAAAGTEEAPAMQIGGREKRGASSVGLTTPEKVKGGEQQQQEAAGRGGNGGGSGQGRKKRLTFEKKDKQEDKKLVEQETDKYGDVKARMAALPEAEQASRQYHASQLVARIEAAGYLQHLNVEKLACEGVFREGFQHGLHTGADLASLGIPEEGIAKMFAHQDLVTRQLVEGSPSTQTSDHRGLWAQATERLAGWARGGSE